MNWLITPMLVPFFTAVVLALLGGKPVLEKAIAAVSTIALALWVFWLTYLVDTEGIQVAVLGGWLAPYGIAFVADRLACIMLCFSMLVASVGLVYTFWTVTEAQQKAFFYPLFQVLILGVNWSFLTGDLFNLFVGYEVMLIGSYGMMMVGGTKEQVRQTMKYIAINSIGSALFIVGVGLIYATTGALNFAALAQYTAGLDGEGLEQKAALVTAASMALLTVFALKSAAWPIFYWLPDTYPIVPSGVNGFFAGVLTKVGVYSLLRVFVMVFRQPGAEFALDILLVLSGFTMLLGVLGAMCQWEIRRILSWHIISQVGYMIMGVGLAGSLDERVANIAIAGTIFYVVHNIIVKSCLFFVGDIAERVTGTHELKKMGGVIDLAPVAAGIFLVAGFSIAGMPPFSGFIAKLTVIQAGLGAGQWTIVAVSVITSFFTLYSMSKIWTYAFWRDKSRDQAHPNWQGMCIPTAVLVVATIVMGVAAHPFLRFASDAARTIQHPEPYIEAVFAYEPPAKPKKQGHGHGHDDGLGHGHEGTPGDDDERDDTHDTHGDGHAKEGGAH